MFLYNLRWALKWENLTNNVAYGKHVFSHPKSHPKGDMHNDSWIPMGEHVLQQQLFSGEYAQSLSELQKKQTAS